MSQIMKHIYDPPGILSDVVTWREYVQELIGSKGDHAQEISRAKKILKIKERS